MNEIAPTGVLLCPDCGSYGSRVDISLVEDKYTHSCGCGYKNVTYGRTEIFNTEKGSWRKEMVERICNGPVETHQAIVEAHFGLNREKKG